MECSNNHSADIQGIILDYGEVLSHRPTEQHIARMAGLFGITVDRFRTLYEKNRRAYDRGDLSPESYWFTFADEPGLALSEDQIPLLRAWDVEMWSNTNPAMIEWLKSVHDGGLRTGLLSNMQEDMIANLLENCNWICHFDCVVFSHSVNLAKPEAKIYEHCLKDMGTAAERTLFIDDREVNVNAAQALGMQVVRFQSVRQLGAELHQLGFPILPRISASS
jgi:putative hydrolase of the HAD superfamily